MIIKHRENIAWGEVNGSFMYGTRVRYYSDWHIHFHNPLMTSGGVIKSWTSSVNYQAARTQPSLPLLKRNHNYRLSLEMDCQPEKGVYIKVTFFDRYNEILEERVEKVKTFDFTYPDNAYTYQVSLLSAGFESLDFYSFSIKEITCV